MRPYVCISFEGLSDVIGKMDKTQRLLATAELQANLLDFWYDVDLGDSTDVQYYFTEDAVLSFDGREIHGRQAIHEGYLKRAEGEDYYDRNTNFTPFSLRVPDGRATTG